jgi:DNA-binding response OmpR family regulator
MPAKRILLVEDNSDIRSLLTGILRREGYSIDEAGTVAEAMGLLDACPYDLALVDWQVPDGDGLLVADSAAQLGAATIVMSGHLRDMPGGRAYGHVSVMKPMLPSELIDAVKSAIGKPCEID